MYLGIDVGGTKTLAACLNDEGVILEHTKFPTPQKYDEFLSQLSDVISQFEHQDFLATGIGIPVTNLHRQDGLAISFAHLGWHNVSVQTDIERLVKTPVALENDAKLGALSEAMLRKNQSKVLYVTISTGIGFGLVDQLHIDPNFGDAGGSLLMLEHQGQLMPWENFASGKAIVERYNKQAHDITDPEIWQQISRNISVGLIELIAICEPDVVVIGGSVGVYLDRFHDFLIEEIKRYETPLFSLPPIEAAIRPEEAVVYGCYDYAKQVFATVQ